MDEDGAHPGGHRVRLRRPKVDVQHDYRNAYTARRGTAERQWKLAMFSITSNWTYIGEFMVSGWVGREGGCIIWGLLLGKNLLNQSIWRVNSVVCDKSSNMN